MQCRSSFLVGSSVLFSVLALAPLADAGWCYCGCCRKADPCRGSAIRSPLESPDPCDCPVGGKFVCRPYYSGYAYDHKCPTASYTATSYGITGAGFGPGGMGYRPASSYGQANFGSYSGANKDEAHLLHLGGFGPGGSQPSRGGRDVIDRIHGQ